MANPFVAEIRMLGCSFAPSGWALCNGQILAISQNTALFSLIGTFYGGNGKSTFALPNLQGRVAIGAGQGPGLTPRSLGEEGGEDQVTLITSEMPAHRHTLTGTSGSTDVATPSGNRMGTTGTRGQQVNAYAATANAQMDPAALAPFGGTQPHNNMMPSLSINFCIALQGVFPPRP